MSRPAGIKLPPSHPKKTNEKNKLENVCSPTSSLHTRLLTLSPAPHLLVAAAAEGEGYPSVAAEVARTHYPAGRKMACTSLYPPPLSLSGHLYPAVSLEVPLLAASSGQHLVDVSWPLLAVPALSLAPIAVQVYVENYLA